MYAIRSYYDRFKLVKGQVDPMISQSPLREVIGSDTLASVTGTYLTFSIFGDLVLLFLLHLVKQPGSQNGERFCLVLMLRLLVLTRYH